MSSMKGLTRMKKLSLHDEDDSPKKVKKNKSKDEREMRKAFELVAKRLLSDALDEMKLELDQRVKESVSRASNELRHEILSIETSLSSRIVTIEGKLNNIASKIEEITSDSNKKIDGVQTDLSNLSNQTHQQLEAERNKRLLTANKIQEKFDLQLQGIQQHVNTIKTDNSNGLGSLNEDVRLQSRELSSLKEKLDEILIKQMGYLPRGGAGGQLSGLSHGLDAGMVLDNISSRIQKLEQVVTDENGDLMASFDRGSPSRFGGGGGGKSSLNRIRKMEENIFELQSQIKENETDIQQIKQSMVKQLRSRSESPVRDRNRSDKEGTHSNEIKEIEKKVKKLAESTTKACRSLSSGLTDVQQATLALYSWTDKVHDGIEVVAHRLNLPHNLCPRAKLPNVGTVGNSTAPSKRFNDLADY